MAKRRELPPQDYLARLYAYDAQTGALCFARGGPVPMRHSERAASLRIQVGDTTIAVNRLIWKLVHGTEPDYVVFLDGDRTNTRLCNLQGMSAHEYGAWSRVAQIGKPRATVARRKAARAVSPKIASSGKKGVQRNHLTNRWVAWGDTVAGHRPYIGAYEALEDAIAARVAWERGEPPPTPPAPRGGSSTMRERKPSSAASGARGVTLRANGKWRVHGRKNAYIGTFATKEEAIAARKKWEEENGAA